MVERSAADEKENMIALLVLLLTFNIYEARVVRVIDGDTIITVVSVWIDLEQTAVIRIRGVDTPELKGKCEAEKNLAVRAKEFTASLLRDSKIKLSNVRNDKFGGRYDADVALGDGRSVADLLVQAGLARKYFGGKRQGWC